MSNPPTTDCGECSKFIIDPDGERTPRPPDIETPCRVCPRGSPEFVPTAQSIWAVSSYLQINPSASPQFPIWQFAGLEIKKFEALSEVHRLVIEWLNKQARKPK